MLLDVTYGSIGETVMLSRATKIYFARQLIPLQIYFIKLLSYFDDKKQFRNIFNVQQLVP